MASRHFDAQVSEVHARLAAMNTMTDLGMPTSVQVGGLPLEKMGVGGMPARMSFYAPTPLCTQAGEMLFFDQDGPIGRSVLVSDFPTLVELPFERES